MILFIARCRRLWQSGCTLLALSAACVAVTPAAAQIGSDRYASIVVDATSGTIVYQVNPDELRFPASLTKMMTLYMLFEAMRDRRVTLNQYVPISANAASMSPTKLGLVPGSLITVEQAILGLVTKSANDAASALGEMLGGDEDRFAQMMTLRARGLGMTRTQFRNASGLPDWAQVTTARDMAILARHLVQDFPGFYHYFSTPSFLFNGRIVRNHQRLLASYPGADGLKTGYTEAAGYNVVTSAVHGDIRLIGVVLGAGNGGERDLHMAALLDQGFERMGVPPAALARRDPSPGLHLPAIVTVARAAPLPEPRPAPHLQAARLPLERTFDRRTPRRTPEPRAERAAAPPARAGATPVRARDAQPLRPAPASTRTAHQQGWYRYPG